MLAYQNYISYLST